MEFHSHENNVHAASYDPYTYDTNSLQQQSFYQQYPSNPAWTVPHQQQQPIFQSQSSQNYKNDTTTLTQTCFLKTTVSLYVPIQAHEQAILHSDHLLSARFQDTIRLGIWDVVVENERNRKSVWELIDGIEQGETEVKVTIGKTSPKSTPPEPLKCVEEPLVPSRPPGFTPPSTPPSSPLQKSHILVSNLPTPSSSHNPILNKSEFGDPLVQDVKNEGNRNPDDEWRVVGKRNIPHSLSMIPLSQIAQDVAERVSGNQFHSFQDDKILNALRQVVDKAGDLKGMINYLLSHPCRLERNLYAHPDLGSQRLEQCWGTLLDSFHHPLPPGTPSNWNWVKLFEELNSRFPISSSPSSSSKPESHIPHKRNSSQFHKSHFSQNNLYWEDVVPRSSETDSSSGEKPKSNDYSSFTSYSNKKKGGNRKIAKCPSTPLSPTRKTRTQRSNFGVLAAPQEFQECGDQDLSSNRATGEHRQKRKKI